MAVVGEVYLVIYKTWLELEKDMNSEIGAWSAIYESKSFVEQMIKKCFFYYSGSNRPPPTRSDWKRAIESFLSKNVQNHKSNVRRPEFQPRRVKAGVDVIYEPPNLLCDFCKDLRVVRAVATDGTHETLMLCDCSEKLQDKADWALPVWTREWAPLYSKEPCLETWFRPQTENGRIDQVIDDRRKYWREKIRIATQFWIEQRKSVTECPF